MRATLLPLLLAAALLVPAAPAAAGFRINRSMEGVQLGMTRAEVRERKGAPADRDRGPDFVTWTYRDPRMEVTFKPDVITLHTSSRRIRGPRDIGVGTSESRLKRVIDRRVECVYTEGGSFCVVGSFEDGRRNTVFVMDHGRVESITIGISTR